MSVSKYWMKDIVWRSSDSLKPLLTRENTVQMHLNFAVMLLILASTR